jgi:rhodanese-related sulfurtransferase
MNGNATLQERRAHPAPARPAAKAPREPGTPGCYRELTPHEFNLRKELTVVLLKDASAAGEFQGFREVLVLPNSQALEPFLAAWPADRAIGLVCPDGTCSSRLAIRLSRAGFPVYHLAGGLREWHQCTICR